VNDKSRKAQNNRSNSEFHIYSCRSYSIGLIFLDNIIRGYKLKRINGDLIGERKELERLISENGLFLRALEIYFVDKNGKKYGYY